MCMFGFKNKNKIKSSTFNTLNNKQMSHLHIDIVQIHIFHNFIKIIIYNLFIDQCLKTTILHFKIK